MPFFWGCNINNNYKKILTMKNVAFGKKVTFDLQPNYAGCSGESVATDLTDGKWNTKGKMWSNPGCVGWRMNSMVSFTVDLGDVQSVSTVKYHIGAGMHGAKWPLNVYVLGSVDDKSYAILTELVGLNREIIPVYLTRIANIWLTATDLDVNVRYLKVIIRVDGMFHFADELEVYTNDGVNSVDLNNLPQIQGTSKDMLERLNALSRLNNDIEILKRNASTANYDINRDLTDLKDKIFSDLSEYLVVKDSIAPVNKSQYELLALNQKILAHLGFKEMTMWSGNRWDPINIFSLPEKDDDSNLTLHMLNGERRGRVFNVTNPLTSEITVDFRCEGDIESSPYEAVCMDTSNGYMISNLLKPMLKNSSGNYQLTLPPGCTKQIWLEIAPRDLKAGQYDCRVVFDDGKRMSVNVHIGSVPFPGRLSSVLGLYDYINSLPSQYPGVDQKNFGEALKIIDKYQINCIWGSSKLIPRMSEASFDADDKLIGDLNYAEMDKWLKLFPDSAYYALFFAGNGGEFAGVDCLKEPEKFQRRVAAFLQDLTAHVKGLGFRPEQFILQFVDEAGDKKTKAILNEWSKAAVLSRVDSSSGYMRSLGNPRMPVSENNSYDDVDILVPMFSYSPDEADYYLGLDKQRNPGSSFGFYSCAENTRQYDPYTYYGLPFRLGCLVNNFHGAHFWNMVTAPNGFNEYEYQSTIFSPLYFEGDKIYGSKQIEATFESREDYEYFNMLSMLTERLKSDDKSLAEEGEQCLNEIRKETASEVAESGQYWKTDKDRSTADRQTRRIWHLINKIYEKHPELFDKRKSSK